MTETLKKLLWVSRPISWPNTAYPFAAAYLVTGGQLNAIVLLSILFFLFPYNLLMYGVNDVFDYESDIKNPRKGGIEGMREQRAFHPVIIKAVVLLTLPFVAVMVVSTNWQQNALLLLVLFMVIAYSLKYLRFKEIPLVDSITSSSHFVGPMVYGLALTDSIQTGIPFILAFFVGVWQVMLLALSKILDLIKKLTSIR